MAGRAIELNDVFQVHLQQEPPRAPVQDFHLGLYSHGHDLAGTPFGEGRLERGEGGGGIPSVGGCEQPLRHQPPQGVTHCDRAYAPILFA